MLLPRLSTHPPRPQMGRAAVCLAVLLLAVAFLFVSAASESLPVAQRVGAGREPPVHCCKQVQAVATQPRAAGDLADLVSAEEQDQNPESHRSKKKKINDDDGDDDDNDDGHDDDDDGQDDDDNGGSDTDHDSDSDSDHNSHSDHDHEHDHDNSKSGKKRRSAPGRKGIQVINR